MFKVITASDNSFHYSSKSPEHIQHNLTVLHRHSFTIASWPTCVASVALTLWSSFFDWPLDWLMNYWPWIQRVCFGRPRWCFAFHSPPVLEGFKTGVFSRTVSRQCFLHQNKQCNPISIRSKSQISLNISNGKTFLSYLSSLFTSNMEM